MRLSGEECGRILIRKMNKEQVMGYSENDWMVRVDFFKPSGKWYTTEAVDMSRWHDHPDMLYAFAKSICDHLRCLETKDYRLSEMVAVCIEPYHKYSYPLMESVERCIRYVNQVDNCRNELKDRKE